ncbi:MAG TPA: EamA/RhaT family transporter [Ruminococcaceae bacterium]|nr:EamA/RhaT family transporter [Oscillospiraceae bacterium]
MAKLLQNRFAACLAAILCTLLWGTAFPFIKLGYQAFEVSGDDIGSMLLFAGLRFTLAGLMVLCFFCASQKSFALPEKSEIRAVLLLGAVQTAAQYLFTYIGIGFTTGANTSIITACASFITVLAAPIFFKSDRLTALKVLGCALGFGGVLLINGGGGFSLDTVFGDVFIFLSTLFAAGGNLIAKRVTQHRNPVKITAYQLLFGGVLLTLTGFACGGRLNLTNPVGVLILFWLALVSAVAFSVWTALLKLHPASKISVFNLLVPVFGTFLSGILLGENVFKTETVISLLLISCGIVLVNLNIVRKNDD